MTSRLSNLRSQTLARSEYALAKHIPNAISLKRILPEPEGSAEPLEPTPKINVKRQNSRFPEKENLSSVDINHQQSEQNKKSSQRFVSVDDKDEQSKLLDNHQEKIRAQAREIGLLKDEINRLRQDQGLPKPELERKIKILENENSYLKEDLNRQRFEKETLEMQLEDLKKRNPMNGINSQEKMRQSQDSPYLRDENSHLQKELQNLRAYQKDLEAQIDKLRNEKWHSDDETRNIKLLLEKERQNKENSDIQKVLLMIEIDRLREELEKSYDRNHTNPDYYDFRGHHEGVKRSSLHPPEISDSLRAANQGPSNLEKELKIKLSDYENKNILFMIEIDRLGRIVSDLQSENDLWRQQVVEMEELSANQMNEFKRQYEQIIRPQIEIEIKNATGKLEADKNSLEIQIGSYQAKIEDLQNNISYLRSEIGKIQERNQDLSNELNEWKFKCSKLEKGTESLKYAIEEEIRAKLEQEKNDLMSKRYQERTEYEDELRKYKQKISEIESKIILIASENEHLLLVTKDKDQEIENLKKIRWENDQIQKEQLDQLRNQYDIAYKERLENEIQTQNMQNERLVSAINNKDDEIENLRKRLYQTEGQQKEQLEEMRSQLEITFKQRLDYEIQNISNQNKHLASVLRTKDEDIEKLRNRLLEADQEKRQQIEEIRTQLEISFKQRIDIEAQTRIQQVELQRGALENEIIALQRKIQSLEEHIDYLDQENQKLVQENRKNEMKIGEFHEEIMLLSDREKEIELWKARYNQLQESHIQEIEFVRTTYNETFKNKLEQELKEAQNKSSAEKSIYEQQLKEAIRQKDEISQKLTLTSTEIERLYFSLAELSQEKDASNRRADDLEREIERLKINIEGQTRQIIKNEIMEINQKFAKERNGLESEIITLKDSYQNLKLKSVLLMAEIERLHVIIFEKENEGDVWRERMMELETQQMKHVHELKKQFEDVLRDKLTDEIKQISGQLQEEKRILESEANSLRSINQEIQEALRYQGDENSKLRRLLEEKQNEIEKLRYFSSQATPGNTDEIRVNMKNQMSSEFENQIKDLTTRFNNERIVLEDQIRQLRNRIAEMEYQLRQAQEQNEILNYNLQQREVGTEKQAKPEPDRAHRSSIPQYQSERPDFENQIQALQQKNIEYQQSLILLSTELERMTQMSLDLKRELDTLKAQSPGIERKSQVEIDQLKIQLEMQYRNEKDNLGRELHNKFASEIENYENQIRELKQKVIDHESNASLITNEVHHLNAVISDKNRETEVWKGKINSIEMMKNQEIQEIRQRLEFEQRATIEKELQGITDQFNFERSQYERKIQDLRQKMVDYENKLIYLAVENDRLNTLYEDKVREVDVWKQRYANLDQANFKDIEEVRIQIESLKRSSLQLSDYEIRFQAERTTYEAQILQYKHKISELEAIITDINKENQRLNSLYYERNAEFEALKRRGSLSDPSTSEEFIRLQKEMEELKKAVMEYHEMKVRFEVERSNYQSQVSQLKQIIEANQTEMAKLYDLLETKKSENETLYREINKIREEAAKKFKNYKELEAEYAMLSNRYKNVNKEIEDLQNARDLYKAQLEKNEVELSEKNKELLVKIRQIDALKARYEQAIANVDPITSNIITRLSVTTREARDI